VQGVVEEGRFGRIPAAAERRRGRAFRSNLLAAPKGFPLLSLARQSPYKNFLSFPALKKPIMRGLLRNSLTKISYHFRA
jgi:hypothetical protein